jgi:hypothetical protein
VTAPHGEANHPTEGQEIMTAAFWFGSVIAFWSLFVAVIVAVSEFMAGQSPPAPLLPFSLLVLAGWWWSFCAWRDRMGAR